MHANSEQRGLLNDECQEHKEGRQSVYLLGLGAAALTCFFLQSSVDVVYVTPHRVNDHHAPPLYLDLLQADDVSELLHTLGEDPPIFVFLSIDTKHHREPESEDQRDKDYRMADAVHQITDKLLHVNVPTAVEAPRHSRVWKADHWAFLNKLLPHQAHVRPCRFQVDSPRSRWITICSNVMWFLGLQGECFHHQHQQRFDPQLHPSLPAAYCQEFVRCVLPTGTQSKHWSPLLLRKNQPRGNRSPQLLPFWVQLKRAPADAHLPGWRRLPVDQGGADQEGDDVLWGFPFSPEEFVNMAKTIRHPIDWDPRLPDELLVMIANIICKSFDQLLQHWTDFCGKLVDLMISSVNDEDDIR